MAQAYRQRQPDPRRGTAPALRLGVALTALLATSGCQSGGVLSLWRQGFDSSLSKGPTWTVTPCCGSPTRTGNL